MYSAPPPSPYAPPPYSRPARPTADVLATALFGAVYLLVGGASVMFSAFFVMATDACTTDEPCDTSGIAYGYLVTDGGGFVVLVVGVLLMVRAATKHRPMWWIPLSAIVVQIALTYLGVTLAIVRAGT